MKAREPRQIKTDRFPKRAPKAQVSRVVRDMLPLEISVRVTESFWQDVGQFFLQIVYIIIKNIFILTDLTDSVSVLKTVETGAVRAWEPLANCQGI